MRGVRPLARARPGGGPATRRGRPFCWQAALRRPSAIDERRPVRFARSRVPFAPHLEDFRLKVCDMLGPLSQFHHVARPRVQRVFGAFFNLTPLHRELRPQLIALGDDFGHRQGKPHFERARRQTHRPPPKERKKQQGHDSRQQGSKAKIHEVFDQGGPANPTGKRRQAWHAFCSKSKSTGDSLV